MAAGTAEATKTDEFNWKALLPDWMIGAWESTKGLAGQVGAFDWRALLPGFISDLFPGDGPLTINEGLSKLSSFDWRALLPGFIADLFPGIMDSPLTISKGLDKVAAFNWKSLLPKFIQDFMDDPRQLAKEDYKWDWTTLLPEFMADFFKTKKGEKLVETATLAFDWWKALLPDWIVNIIDGKSPFAEREAVTEEEIAQKKKDATESAVGLAKAFDMSSILEGIDFSMFDLGKFPIVGDLNFGEKFKTILSNILMPATEADKNTYGGGIVATRPTWLPSSGTVVGEHSTWGGYGAYTGGIPDGGAEAVIPLGADRAGVFIDPMARSIAGEVMNQLAMERISLGNAGDGGSPTIITDNSTTVQNNDNSTRIPSPSGQMLPDEGREFVHKVA